MRKSGGKGRDESTVVVTLPDGRRVLVHLITADGGQAKVGIDADKDIIVHRLEVQKQLDAEATGVQP